MASIVKRKNKYSVVYTYQDEKGEKRQKWETFATNAEAKKRKAEVEFQQESGTLVIPEAKTVRELLEDYTSIYGVNTWAMSTYEARRSLIFNYINPIIGDMKLSDLNTRVMEKYYQNLLKVKSRVVNNRKPNNEYLSCHVVREIHKLLRCAFNQAVKWELMAKNPCINATLRFLYKGIIIKHNKTEPTYTKTSLFLCEKRRFLWPGLRKEGNLFKLAGPGGLAFFHLTKKEVSKWPMKK